MSRAARRGSRRRVPSTCPRRGPVRFTLIVKVARNFFALLMPLFGVLLAGGPLGCEVLGLGPPAPPKLPAPAVPETPEIEIPAPPEPPEVKPPDQPTVDTPDPEDGACCLRGGEAVGRTCGAGVQRCCTQKLERDECESSGGLWFHTGLGCAGAC